jgi:hypothetical protein
MGGMGLLGLWLFLALVPRRFSRLGSGQRMASQQDGSPAGR